MTQPIKIQLNADALAALFPEGSGARIELQNAVVAEFTKKHLRESAFGPAVKERVERARADALAAVSSAKNEVFTQTVQQLGADTHGWGGVRLSTDLVRRVSDEAHKQVNEQILSSVAERVKAAAGGLSTTIAHDVRVAVNSLVDAEIRAAVRAKVQAVVESLGKEST